MRRQRAARYAAPVAFLAAITIAALLVRAGLQQGSPAKSPTTTSLTQTAHKRAKKAPRARYHRVRQGETFGSIAARLGTTVTRLERLNPGVDPNALHVGQKIRVK